MSPQPLSTFTRDFDDFDELCELVRGWDLELRQLETGRFRGQARQVASARSLLSLGRFGRRVEQSGDPPPHGRTFGIPTPDCPAFVWRGEPVGPGDVLVFGNDTELRSFSPAGFGIHTYSASHEQVAAVAEDLKLSLHRQLERGTVLHLGADRTAPLSTHLDALLDTAVGSSLRTGDDVLRRRLDDGVAREILLLLGDADPRGRRTDLRARQQLFHRVHSRVAAQGDEIASVANLCELTGVNERTMRRAFEENCGISPKAYLQARRLNAARRLLSSARSRSTTVNEIANRFGFWHMGQFAADYRRQFGELPSHTLARMPRTNDRAATA